MKRFLIIRLSAMGDVLLTTPLIRMLRAVYPDAEIDFLVKKAYVSLLEQSPHLNRVLSLSPEKGFSELVQLGREIRKHRYDHVIDLQMNMRSYYLRSVSAAGRVTWFASRRLKRFLLVKLRRPVFKIEKPVPLRYLEAVSSLGVHDDSMGLELHIDNDVRQTVLSRLSKSGVSIKDRVIAIAPGASRATKRWLPERFGEVGGYFSQKGFKIILIGGSEDQETCAHVNRAMSGVALDFSGHCNLIETAVLLEQAQLLVTNDTGVMHMASAFEKPLVAVFGPTSEHLGFRPFRTPSVMVEKKLSCRPCSYHGTAHCPKHHFKCMLDISSGSVIEAAEQLLA